MKVYSNMHLSHPMQNYQYLSIATITYVICRKLHAKPYFYPEPPPPNELRLQDKRAFSTIGIENFGPLVVIYDNANNEMHKAWVTLYACASTWCQIFDLMPSLPANSLKNILKRFISCRGYPDNVISDNDSNFVAIETQNFASNLNILRHFNLALAPWRAEFLKDWWEVLRSYRRKICEIIKLH